MTAKQLRMVMRNRISQKKAEEYIEPLVEAMVKYGITSRRRKAAFLAQLAIESGWLRYFEEIASGQDYEGRKDLGNTHPGDGKRYKGRGPIQLTGRANYIRYGQYINVNLEEHPELASTPKWGFMIAALYWSRNYCNTLADTGTYESFREITLRINGGYNALAARWTEYLHVLKVLEQK